MEECMLDTRITVKLACCLALALGIAAGAARQSRAAAPEERGDLDAIRKVSTLLGTTVVNRANSTVAHVRDLVLSAEGDVLYVILGRGGVARVGETDIAAPWDALGLRPADGKWTAILDMTADDLKKAPEIRSENYREFTDPQWIGSVHQFFRSREALTGADRTPRAVDRVLLATKIRHSKLRNGQNEDLGKIEDMLLNRMHRVAFLIVGEGGVLSIGERYVPVPWSVLGINTNASNAAVTVAANATHAQMERAPLVKSDYTTLLEPGFADQVRSYFGATRRVERR
jgi:hypothetical protein